MQIGLVKKSLVLFVIVLFTGAGFVPSLSGTITSLSNSGFRGTTLYVGGSGGGNYSSIQAAIDDADDDDTVFVYDESSLYYENVVIDKTINLIGEDRDTTVIDGSGSGDVIYVDADWVNITGFTVQNSGEYRTPTFDSGIEIHANYTSILSTNISNNNFGVYLNVSSNNTISGNILSKNNNAVCLNSFSRYNNISGNTIVDNVDLDARTPDWGINLNFASDHNIIAGNTIVNNAGGIVISTSSYNNISWNIIRNNGGGIMLDNNAHHNTFFKNTIQDHDTLAIPIPGFGIGIGRDSSNNSVMCNNFINNALSAGFFTSGNTWDKNYWDRPRFFPKIIIGFKIVTLGDDRWIILPGMINVDWHPAREPYDIT